MYNSLKWPQTSWHTKLNNPDKKTKPATRITKERCFYLLCSKLSVPICPQSGRSKTQEPRKRGRDPTALEVTHLGNCLLSFPLKVLAMLHKGRHMQAYCPSTESLIQHSQSGFGMQVQFPCDFKGRLLAHFPCGCEIWGTGSHGSMRPLGIQISQAIEVIWACFCSRQNRVLGQGQLLLWLWG